MESYICMASVGHIELQRFSVNNDFDQIEIIPRTSPVVPFWKHKFVLSYVKIHFYHGEYFCSWQNACFSMLELGEPWYPDRFSNSWSPRELPYLSSTPAVTAAHTPTSPEPGCGSHTVMWGWSNLKSHSHWLTTRQLPKDSPGRHTFSSIRSRYALYSCSCWYIHCGIIIVYGGPIFMAHLYPWICHKDIKLLWNVY